MSNIESIKNRLEFATKNILKRNVVTMKRNDWESLIRNDGHMTHVESLSGPFANLIEQAQIIAVTACGYNNQDPSINIVRYDEKDAPYIYNLDKYTVVQSFCLHNQYQSIINQANVKDSLQLQECLKEYIFITKNKPSEVQNHWSKEIPEIIKNANAKNKLI